MMRQNPHGGDIYSQAYDYDFSVNINPLGPPERVVQAVKESVDGISCYPDTECRELRRALSEREQVPEESLIFGNGAAELIFGLVQAIRPRKALLPAPSFAEYEAALAAGGCFIRYCPLLEEEGFRLGEKYLSSLTEDLDLAFLCNPNNPTGIVTDRKFVLAAAERCERNNIVLVVDECFVEFLPEPEQVTIKEELDRYPGVFLLKAFTKTYAMPGLRLGYGICSSEQLLHRVSSCLPSWNVSVPAQRAGLAALGEEEYVRQARALLAEERPWMKRQLEQLGCRVWDSQANYLFFSGPERLAERLQRGGILIRDCSNYPGLGPGYYRVAVRKRKENLVLIDALEQILRWI